MYDLAIIGGGYWGVAAALMAEAAGKTVCVVSSAEPLAGSAAASGHFAYSWYNGVWRERAVKAAADAEAHGVSLLWTGADAVIAGKLGAVRHKKDWAVFDVPGFLGLREPNYHQRVLRVEPQAVGHRVTFADTQTLDAHNVYLACGAWTDALLVRSGFPALGVTGLGGTGLVYKHPWDPDKVFQVAINPFKQYSFRGWGEGFVRVGETTEAGQHAPDYYLAKMRGVIQPYVGSWGGPVKVIRGLRAMHPDGMFVRELADGMFVGSGGGKVGGVMSFWAARTLLEALR